MNGHQFILTHIFILVASSESAEVRITTSDDIACNMRAVQCHIDALDNYRIMTYSSQNFIAFRIEAATTHHIPPTMGSSFESSWWYEEEGTTSTFAGKEWGCEGCERKIKKMVLIGECRIVEFLGTSS